MNKLIYFDTVLLDSENDQIKNKLYELFFVWKETQEQAEISEVVVKDEKQEKMERMKRA